MDENTLFLHFGSALAIGLLVGLQREYSKGTSTERLFAGVRTYPLLALAGAAGGLLSDSARSALPLVAVMAMLGGLVGWAYVTHTRTGRVGATTEVSAILTVLAGALCYYGHIGLAAALGVVTTALLSLKPQMHGFVRRLDREDIYAVVKFAVITAVILPVLPDRTYGPVPLDVLNPYRIWLMVVFVSAISFLGYVLLKVLDPRRGLLVNGLLGGLVSSTASTVSMARRSREQDELGRPIAVATTLSWAVAFVRVLVIVAVLNPALARLLLPALLAPTFAALAYGVLLYLRHRSDGQVEMTYVNPFELRPALGFGAVYAMILLVARAAEVYWGNAGVFASSVLGSLVSQTAVALSLAEAAAGTGRLGLDIAAWALVISSVANLVVKGIMALAAGAPSLRRPLWVSIAVLLAALLGAAAITL